jgi:hypothetical protein
MTRFTTDVTASYAYGINGNSLKDPVAEFRCRLWTIFHFTARKGLTAVLQLSSPSVLCLIKLKSVDTATDSFINTTVWSAVEYRHGYSQDTFFCWTQKMRNRLYLTYKYKRRCPIQLAERSKRRSAAAHLLRLWVWNPPGAWMSVVSAVRCQVDVSATSWSLDHRSPTDCGALLCVI